MNSLFHSFFNTMIAQPETEVTRQRARTRGRATEEAAAAVTEQEIALTIRRAFAAVRSNPLETLDLARRAAQQAHSIANVAIEVEALIACGEACHRLGRNDEHFAYYKTVEALTPAIEDLAYRAKALQELGRTCRIHGDTKAALRFYRAALEIRKTLRDPADLALTIDSIGHIHIANGRYARALTYHLRSLRIRERIGDPLRIAVSLLHIGNCYGALEDYAMASKYFRRCLELIQPLASSIPLLPATALGNLGSVCVELGNPKEGLPMIHQALATLTSFNEIAPMLKLLYSAAVAYDRIADWSQSLEFYQKALAMAGRHELHAELLEIYSGMGKVHQRLGDYRNAFDCYAKASEVYDQAPVRARLNLHKFLSELYSLLHDYRQALEEHKKEEQLREMMRGTRQQRAVAAAEMRHAMLATHRKEKLLQRQAEQAEREANAKTRELNSIVLNLTRRDNVLKSIREFLKPLSREARGKTRETAKKVLADIGAAIDTHAECRAVEDQFEQIHHDFIRRLNERCPRLTPTEIRICVLIRLGLSVKQMADTLFASELTVRTHRKHIRRKLALATEENLGSLLLSI